MQQILKMDVRKTARSRCRIDSKVKYFNQEADGRVLNVSRSGIALELYSKLHASAGSQILIESDDIGLIEGTVRWCRNGRLGVQIKQTSNSLAQIAAYFRHFHKEVRPVLGR